MRQSGKGEDDDDDDGGSRVEAKCSPVRAGDGCEWVREKCGSVIVCWGRFGRSGRDNW